MVRVVTVNISDFKTTSMRIRTAVIVTIVTVPGYIAVSYTHLTLPTNREV